MGAIKLGAGGYLSIAALIVVLMPIIVLPMDGKRLPNIFYGIMAACGLLLHLWNGGWSSVGAAIVSALALMLMVGGLVTLLRQKLRIRILSGGHIKLMGAGAMWLGPWGTIAMVLITIAMLFVVAVWRNMRDTRGRSVPVAIIVSSILMVALQQNFPLQHNSYVSGESRQ